MLTWNILLPDPFFFPPAHPLSLDSVHFSIVGPIGSTIKVMFEKPDGQTFERTFTRMNAQASTDGDYADQMMKRANGASMDTSTMGHRGLSVSASAVSMGVEPELVRLRGRVHELESELTICKDELSRARSLIEQDKDSSTRLRADTCTCIRANMHMKSLKTLPASPTPPSSISLSWKAQYQGPIRCMSQCSCM